MHTEEGQRPRTGIAELGLPVSNLPQKYSKYATSDSLAMRASVGSKNKFTASISDANNGKENNPASSNPSTKLFYLKKNKLESSLAMSYNSGQFGTYLSTQKENYDENAVLGSSLKNYLNSRKDKMVTSHRRSQWADQKKGPTGDSSRDSQVLKDKSISSASKTQVQTLTESNIQLNNYLQQSNKQVLGSASNRFSSQRAQTSPNEGSTQDALGPAIKQRSILAEIIPNNHQASGYTSNIGRDSLSVVSEHGEHQPQSIRDITAVRESLGIPSEGGKTLLSLDYKFSKSYTSQAATAAPQQQSVPAGSLGSTGRSPLVSEQAPVNHVPHSHYQLLASSYQSVPTNSTMTAQRLSVPSSQPNHKPAVVIPLKSQMSGSTAADELPSPALASSPQPACKERKAQFVAQSQEGLPPAPIKGEDTPRKLGFSAAGGVLGRKTKVEVRDSLEKELPRSKHNVQLDPTRRSTQESGVIKSYAVNTNEGLVRDYNEDRVSIILNIMQSGRSNDPSWPKSAFFGLYDGHCGSACAEFLRDNLHKYILRDKNFPSNPREAIREGIMRAETEFYKKSVDSKGDLIEKSGSCAVILLVVDEVCYVANVGDSRAVLSKNGGKEAVSVTEDHKPCSGPEKERIMKAGGKIYRSQIQTLSLENDPVTGEEFEKEEIVNGPYRVFPGRLSVCRTFGDFEAKMTKYGGNPGVVVVDPDIFEVKVDSNTDFMLLGCDGVFDRFTTEELVSRVWETSSNKQLKGNFHDVAAEIVENIFEDTFQRKAWDNITVILVCFKNLFTSLAKMKQKLYRSEKDPRMLGLHG